MGGTKELKVAGRDVPLVAAKCGKQVRKDRVKAHEQMCGKCGGRNATLPDAGAKATAKDTAPEGAGIAARSPEATSSLESPAPGSGQPIAPQTAGAPGAIDREAMVNEVGQRIVAAITPQLQSMAAAIQKSQANVQELVKAEVAATLKPLLERMSQDEGGTEPSGPAGPGGGFGVLTELAKIYQIFKGPPKEGAQNIDQVFKMMRETMQLFMEPFISGTEFSARLISSATKVGGDAGVAADYIMQHRPKMVREPDQP